MQANDGITFEKMKQEVLASKGLYSHDTLEAFDNSNSFEDLMGKYGSINPSEIYHKLELRKIENDLKFTDDDEANATAKWAYAYAYNLVCGSNDNAK